MNKKGLSAVITTVLLILLAIIAVVIVWQVVKGTIQTSAGSIQTKCIAMDVKIEDAGCVSGSGVQKIKITRNAGDLDKVKVMLGDSAGTLQEPAPIDLGADSLQLMASQIVEFDLIPNGITATTASLGIIVLDSNGAEQTCGAPQSIAINCAETAAVLTTIQVTPASQSLAKGATQQFSAVGKDQSGNAISPQPTFTWTSTAGGTINTNGLFTAGNTAGTSTITATSGTVSGTATATVI